MSTSNDPDVIGRYYQRKAAEYKQASAAYEQAKRTDALMRDVLGAWTSKAAADSDLRKRINDWLNWSADELRRLKQRMELAAYTGD